MDKSTVVGQRKGSGIATECVGMVVLVGGVPDKLVPAVCLSVLWWFVSACLAG